MLIKNSQVTTTVIYKKKNERKKFFLFSNFLLIYVSVGDYILQLKWFQLLQATLYIYYILTSLSVSMLLLWLASCLCVQYLLSSSKLMEHMLIYIVLESRHRRDLKFWYSKTDKNCVIPVVMAKTHNTGNGIHWQECGDRNSQSYLVIMWNVYHTYHKM